MNEDIKILNSKLSITYMFEGHDADITIFDTDSCDTPAKIEIYSDELKDSFGFEFNDKADMKKFVSNLDSAVEDFYSKFDKIINNG
jgi:hypothetical protein